MENDIKTEPDDSSREHHGRNAAKPAEPFQMSAISRYNNRDDPFELEERVRRALVLLHDMLPWLQCVAALKVSSTARKNDASGWVNSVNEIIKLEEPTRTIISLAGTTGSGKSSLVNALLDVEQLLPTSCTRACTSCVTEVSYNYEENESEPFRAEIELISHVDWLDEIRVLLQEIAEAKQSECTNPDTDAGAAFAKLAAVYPHLSVETAREIKAEYLMENAEVFSLLSRDLIVLRAASPNSLSDKMQKYVQTQRQTEKIMEYWPLVKVVKVFVKAFALETGAVIVDLPGLRDSNAARAAVAEKYIKNCSSMWIVAPIQRAVDDQSANGLVGGAFRTQMMFDDLYSAVTYVCSKTDDISVSEVTKDPSLDADLQKEIEEQKTLQDEVQVLQERMRNLKTKRKEIREGQSELEAKLKTLEAVPADGRDAQGSVATSLGKRKRDDTDGTDNTDDADDDGVAQGDAKANNSEALGQPCDPTIELKKEKARLRMERQLIDDEIDDTESKLEMAETRKIQLSTSVKESCLNARNMASIKRIRFDFEDTMKEADQAKAREQDESSFNPDVEDPKYHEIAQRMPIFCVSSRAYQKLNKRMQADDFNTTGFRGLDDTQIPALHQHARKLTEKTRLAKCRKILGKTASLLLSIQFWLTGGDVVRAGIDWRSIETFLHSQFHRFEGDLRKRQQDCLEKLSRALEVDLCKKFTSVAEDASIAALQLPGKWLRPVRNGGFASSTFKSVCRRRGIHQPRYSPAIDLHQQLANLVMQRLKKVWKETLTRVIPRIIEDFTISCREILNSLQDSIKKRFQKYDNLAKPVNMLEECVQIMTETISGLSSDLKKIVEENHRNANRAFVPPIAKAMDPIYDVCQDIKGNGSMGRIRKEMHDHLEEVGADMFGESVEAVESKLDAMEVQLANKIGSSLTKIYDEISRQTHDAFIFATKKREVQDGEIVPKEKLTAILGEIGTRFDNI